MISWMPIVCISDNIEFNLANHAIYDRNNFFALKQKSISFRVCFFFVNWLKWFFFSFFLPRWLAGYEWRANEPDMKSFWTSTITNALIGLTALNQRNFILFSFELNLKKIYTSNRIFPCLNKFIEINFLILEQIKRNEIRSIQ